MQNAESRTRNEGRHGGGDPGPEEPGGSAAVVFDERGLAPVVVQAGPSGRVLMLAWANAEALRKTLESGEAWFWSRSRMALWRKGASSGNTMKVLEVRVDCDADALLYLVDPAGPACHTGQESCFFRRLQADGRLEDL